MNKCYWQRLQIWLISVLFFIIFSNAHAASRRVKNCLQPTISGRCFGYVPSYAYNPLKRNCDQFIYGGCGGNDNRFATRAECEYMCRDI